MSYSSEKTKVSRHSIWIVRISLDFCILDYGQTNTYGTCNATDTEKCYKTFYTCKSRNDFWTEIKSQSESERWYKQVAFCDYDANIPHTIAYYNYLGYVIKPYLRDININVGKITPFGYEAGTATIKLLDCEDDAPELDPYFSERTTRGGTYFTKLVARYPNLKNRMVYISRAYWDSSGDVSGNIKDIFTGYIDSSELRNGSFEIKAIDVLAYIFRQTIPKRHKAKAHYLFGGV